VIASVPPPDAKDLAMADAQPTTARQHWTGIAFIVLFALGIGTDILIVEMGYESISWRTWTAQELHPMLTVGGLILTYGVAWLVRRNWHLVGLAALLGGHLFCHA
jgi:hypothetical protein